MSILKEFEDGDGAWGRILSVTPCADGTFEVREQCDGYFYVILTAAELRQLGNELIELSNQQTKDRA